MHTTLHILHYMHCTVSSPYTNTSKLTNQDFLNEFTEWGTDILADNNNLLLLDNFNIHIDEANDDDAANFTDTLKVLGMTQHIKFSTHKANHIIDHIYTELFSNIKVTNCEQKDLISDHYIIVFNTSIPKPVLTTTTISYRKLKEVNQVAIAQKVSLNGIYPNFDSRVEAFNDQLATACDKLAPLKTKTLNTQQPVLWFTDHVIDWKRSMRRKEKIWKQYRRDDHWKDFTIDRNKYR